MRPDVCSGDVCFDLGGVALALAVLAAAPAAAQTAALKDPRGRDVGTATLTPTPHGVLMRVVLRGFPQGEHGFHIHEKGACTPTFEAAGGHLAGGREHGFLNPNGPHAGDLPNIHVPASGALTVEVLAPAASVTGGEAALLDQDGAAIIVHADPDDYRSQPAGHAGDRIACGVIEERRE